MAFPPTNKEDCDAAGFFWNAGKGVCEVPQIAGIQMTFSRGSGCDGPNHHALILKPKKLSKAVLRALLEAAHSKSQPKRNTKKKGG